MITWLLTSVAVAIAFLLVALRLDQATNGQKQYSLRWAVTAHLVWTIDFLAFASLITASIVAIAGVFS